MKTLSYLSIALMLVLVVMNVSAVTVQVGDNDGFGFAPEKVPTLVGVDKKPVDRKIENKKVQFEEVLPDINKNGVISYTAGDNYDNRSAAEKADVANTGVKWTDVTLSKSFIKRPGLANDVVFTFTFEPPTKKNEPGYGEDHVFSLIYADYDVKPMTADVDGTVWPMERFIEIGTVDGGIGSLVVTVPWKDMEDGKVVVKLIAPNEPYTIFDYALLDEAPVNIGPYPICANEQIPVGTHYILPTGAAKSTLDKAVLAKGVQLTILSARSANCKPKTTGKGEPGHYLHCSDTMIENGNYFVFPEKMAAEIDAALEKKETTEGSGMVFSIISTKPEECPVPEKEKKK